MKNKLVFLVAVIVLLLSGFWYVGKQKEEVKSVEANKVKIAYLPVVQALPLYLALEKGYFKEAGIEAQPVKFEAPNQIIDALLSGQVDFGSPSTAMGITAISQAKKPNTLKIFALNGGVTPNNIDNVLLVRKNSGLMSVKDLKGAKLGILPGIQFRTIVRHILKTEGIDMDKDVDIVELAVPLQLQALASGKIDAVLSLEPVGVIGRSKEIARDLVLWPINKYISDPWYGGGGVVNAKFADNNPDITEKVLRVFDKAIKEIGSDPESARKFLKNYTPLTKEQIESVPMPIWKMYTGFVDSDVKALQKFFDIFIRYGVIKERVEARSLIYSR